ncbi:MAG TPA: DnaB-like helicase C-terminal domain-containing protein [Rhizomicrobium sp.]|jgi:replicative DNA helicase|nr:DnaB-like helicase C-terminal domain-containing protein [Rhizomicrobium sp.]
MAALPGDGGAQQMELPTHLHDAELEMALIGALLSNNNQVDRVADSLTAEDFGDPLLADIYRVIVREVAAGRDAIVPTIAPMFAGNPGFEQIGGRHSLVTWSMSVIVNSQPATNFSKAIKEVANRRRLWLAMQASMRALEDPAAPVADIMSQHEADLSSFTGESSEAVFHSAADCVDEVIASFNRPRNGVTSGTVEGMDRLLGAIRPGWLGIVAARPGMGKTAALLSYFRGAASRGHHSLYFSLEVGWETLSTRVVSDAAYAAGKPILYDAIVNATVQPHHQREICRLRDEIESLPLHVVDKDCHTIGGVRRQIRRYKRWLAAKGKKLELVVIDYLQLLSPDQQGLSDTEAVSRISRALKVMAVEEEVAIIAAAQLNREVEKREDKRPTLSDLRSSGQIEADADFVVFLLSQEYYHRAARPRDEHDPKYAEWEERLRLVENELEFILAKFRHGSIGNFFGRFFRDYQAVR